jgi:hypothetical protein
MRATGTFLYPSIPSRGCEKRKGFTAVMNNGTLKYLKGVVIRSAKRKSREQATLHRLHLRFEQRVHLDAGVRHLVPKCYKNTEREGEDVRVSVTRHTAPRSGCKGNLVVSWQCGGWLVGGGGVARCDSRERL